MAELVASLRPWRAHGKNAAWVAGDQAVRLQRAQDRFGEVLGMKIRLRRVTAAVAAIMAMAGCVTVPPPGYRPQALAVSTHEVPGPRLGWGSRPQGPSEEIRGVECTASNDRGSWATVTPGVLAVERSAARLKITCRRDGYQDARVDLPCVTPGTQAMAAWGAVYLIPAAMLVILPATAIGAIAAANRHEGEPNYCLYGAGSAVQVLMER